jgi:hypothetical protein
MRASEFLNEENFGTLPKRKMREGSRPPRGHKPTHEEFNVDEDIIDEEPTSKADCIAARNGRKKLGKSAIDSCKAQGTYPREAKTGRKVKIRGKMVSMDGAYLKSDQYGGPIKTWKGN